MLASVLAVVVVPGVAFGSGIWAMRKLADRAYVQARLREVADPADQAPLNRRYRGYDAPAVARHWSALDDRALRSEDYVLKLDLAFPVLYGGAVLLSFLYAQLLLYDPEPRYWLTLPVLIAVLADWVENLVLLKQLRRFRAQPQEAMEIGWIRIASGATTVKWIALILCVVPVAYSAWRLLT